jgi:hypothetical protein
MVDQIGALADDGARAVANRLESNLAGLLHQFLCHFSAPAGEQTRRAGVVLLLHPVEVAIEARDFRRIRPELSAGIGKYRL